MKRCAKSEQLFWQVPLEQIEKEVRETIKRLLN